jgi:hypothetical protein
MLITRIVARLAGAVLLGGFVFLAGGCGYKTPPVPPQAVVPQPVADLLYTIDGEDLTLTWSFPVKTIKGSVVDNISTFELYRAEIPLDDYCGGCPIPFGSAIEVEGGSPVDGEIRRKASYVSSMLQTGYKYFFKVKSRTSWLAASGDSNIVTFVYFQPAAAPKGLSTTEGDGEIKLSWKPVTKLLDGSNLENPVNYQVYRSVRGKDFEKVGDPVSETSLVDKPLVNGTKYFYAVQPLMEYKGETVAGGRSDEISAVPMDATPPVPPGGVMAVATGVGVKIFWDKSSETDLGGYNVYRRAADKDNFELLGKVEPQFSLFVDNSGDSNTRYYYTVTAIDSSNPPNESYKSKEATIR